MTLATASTSSVISAPTPAWALVRLLRPEQWLKNLLVFAALLFSRRLFVPHDVLRVLILFGCFSAMASAVYIFNDWVDAAADRANPTKAGRPLAAGTVPVPLALGLAGILAAAGIIGVVLTDPFTAVWCAAYLVINVLYTLDLKSRPILDVGCIASGFVLRAFAGATMIAVPISRWLILCSMFLALFLGVIKRRQELVHLRDNAGSHRPVLKEYTEAFLDHMSSVLAAATLVCYTLYTLDAETVARFSTDRLVYTVPFVLYGIFRYLYLVHRQGLGATPGDVLLRDRPLAVTLVLWAGVAAAVIYR